MRQYWKIFMTTGGGYSKNYNLLADGYYIEDNIVTFYRNGTASDPQFHTVIQCFSVFNIIAMTPEDNEEYRKERKPKDE